MKKIEDILERALKSFLQGFIASMAIILPNTDLTAEGVAKSLLIGGITGGLSYLMNYLNNLLSKEER